MLVHSGASARRRANGHVHVFVIQHRWQKAWLYTLLAAKSIGLTLRELLPASAPDREARDDGRIA